MENDKKEAKSIYLLKLDASDVPITLNPLSAYLQLAELGEVPAPTFKFLKDNNYFGGFAGQGKLYALLGVLEGMKNPQIRQSLKQNQFGNILDSVAQFGKKIIGLFRPAQEIAQKFVKGAEPLLNPDASAEMAIEQYKDEKASVEKIADQLKFIPKDMRENVIAQYSKKLSVDGVTYLRQLASQLQGYGSLGQFISAPTIDPEARRKAADADKQLFKATEEIWDKLKNIGGKIGRTAGEANEIASKMIRAGLNLQGYNPKKIKKLIRKKIRGLRGKSLYGFICDNALADTEMLLAEHKNPQKFGERGIMSLAADAMRKAMPWGWLDWIIPPIGGLLLWWLAKKWVFNQFTKVDGYGNYGGNGDSQIANRLANRNRFGNFVSKKLTASKFGNGTDNPLAAIFRAYEPSKTLGSVQMGSLLGELALAETELGMPLDGDFDDYYPNLGTYELAAIAELHRINPNYLSAFKTLAKSNYCENPQTDFAQAALLLGSLDNARVGELGSALSKTLKKIKNLSRSQFFAQKQAKEQQALIDAGIGIKSKWVGPFNTKRSLSSEQIKKRADKRALKAAKKLDALKAKAQEFQQAVSLIDEQKKLMADQAAQAQTVAEKTALEKGQEYLADKQAQLVDASKTLEPAMKETALEVKEAVAEVKPIIAQEKAEASIELEKEAARIEAAKKMEENKMLASNLIVMTPREYAEHIKNMEESKTLVKEVNAKMNELLRKRQTLAKAVAKQKQVIYDLKLKLADISKRLATSAVNQEVKTQVEKERDELVSRLQAIKDQYQEQLFRIKNMSDEGLKEAGKQINQSGMIMMFEFFDRLSGAMRNVKDLSQVSEFLRFFPEILNSFKLATEIVAPKPPEVNNEINLPEPNINVNVPPTSFSISPNLKIYPAEIDLHPQNISTTVPVNVQPPNVSVMPQNLQVTTIPVPVEVHLPQGMKLEPTATATQTAASAASAAAKI